MGGCGNLRYSSSLRDAIYHRQCANTRMLAGPGSVAKKPKSWKPWILKGSPSRKKRDQSARPARPCSLTRQGSQGKRPGDPSVRLVGPCTPHPQASLSPVLLAPLGAESALRCGAVQQCSALLSLSRPFSCGPPLSSLPTPLLQTLPLFIRSQFRVTHSSFRPASTETPVGLVALALEFPNPTNSTPALSSRRALSSRNPVPIVTRLETRRVPSPSLSCQATLACFPSAAHWLS